MDSGNAASVASNLGGVFHGHLTLTMSSEEYTAQMGYVFVPYNPSDNLPPMGTTKEQALRNENSDKTKHYSVNTPPWT